MKNGPSVCSGRTTQTGSGTVAPATAAVPAGASLVVAAAMAGRVLTAVAPGKVVADGVAPPVRRLAQPATAAAPDEAATTAINWSISRRVSNRPMGRSSWSIEVSPSVMQAILPEVARLEIGE